MKSALHITLLTLLFSLMGCSSLPRPMRDNEFGNYLSAQCAEGVNKAILGDQSGFHTCFFAAYSRVRDPLRGGEDIQSIRLSLETLLQAVGDDAFAYHLGNEPEPVRSGVAWFLQGVYLGDTPKTHNLLDQTQDYNFELITARRRN
jgi:hypothetical protein